MTVNASDADDVEDQTDTVATDTVVVGYDGSEEAATAVDWAAVEALLLGKSLMVLHAATSLQPIGGPGEEARSDTQESSRSAAEEGAERARQAAPGLTVTAMADPSGAASALVRLSEQASLVVVGNRGRGRVTGALLGSVAFAVATHAHCPLVVARGDAKRLTDSSRPVVVGIDGSGNAALDYATEVAAESDAELRVLVAWEAVAANPWDQADLTNPHAGQEKTAAAHQAAEALVEQAADRARSRRPDLSAVHPEVVQGRPEEVLTQASTGAGRVVLGARGRGDLASLLLGSISRAVIHRAECPVTIIR